MRWQYVREFVLFTGLVTALVLWGIERAEHARLDQAVRVVEDCETDFSCEMAWEQMAMVRGGK